MVRQIVVGIFSRRLTSVDTGWRLMKGPRLIQYYLVTHSEDSSLPIWRFLGMIEESKSDIDSSAQSALIG